MNEHTLNRWGIVEQTDHYQLRINKTEYNTVLRLMEEFEAEGGTWSTSSSEKATDDARNRITAKCLMMLHVIRYKHKYTKGFLTKEIDVIESTHLIQSQMKSLLIEANLIEVTKEWNGAEFKSTRYFLSIGDVENWYSVSKEILEPVIKQIIKWEKNYLNKYSRLDGIKFEDGYDAISHCSALIQGDKYTENEKFLKSVATQNIVDGNWNSSFKKFRAEQRLYCPVNQIPSGQVCHLVDVNNSKMVEIDIKSSHPRILVNVITEMAKNVLNEDNFTKFYKDLLGTEENVQLDQYIARLEIESKILKNIVNGDLYGSISREMFVSRDQAKTEFMYFINNYHSDIKNVENYYYFFMSKVPLITRFIRKMHSIERINKKLGRVEPKYYIHQQLSRYESQIVLGVCKDFIKTHKNSTDFSIAPRHDSIVITKKYTKEIEEKLILKGLEEDVHIVLDTEDFSLDTRDSEYLNNQNLPKTNQELKTYPISISYGRNEGLSAQNEVLSAQSPLLIGTEVISPEGLIRTKVSLIRTLNDGRLTCSIKNKNMNSRKGETLEQFQVRCVEAGAIINIHSNQN